MTKIPLPCLACGSLNTWRCGYSSNGHQRIRCCDCGKTITNKPPTVSLSDTFCDSCGRVGCNYRNPNLCRNCYNKQKNKIKNLESDLMKLAIAESLKVPSSWDWFKFAKELYQDGVKSVAENKPLIVKLIKAYI